EHDRVAAGGNADAERIGADAWLLAAWRGDAAAEAVVVDRREKRHLARGGRFRVFAEPADVSAIAQGPRGEPERLRPGDEPIEQPMRLHLPQAPAAVHDEDRRGLLDDV